MCQCSGCRSDCPACECLATLAFGLMAESPPLDDAPAEVIDGDDSAVDVSPALQGSSGLENAQGLNIFQVLYNDNHPPYLYGVIQTVDSDVSNQRSTRPFVISKQLPNGQEVVYGTVASLLGRIRAQLSRHEAFTAASDAKLAAAGVAVATDNPVLPSSELTHGILAEQERLIEDVLLATAVHIRILTELFPHKLKSFTVPILDYDDVAVADVELKRIGDLLVHNRFMTVREPYIVDLISDLKFLTDAPEMGLKFDFLAYLQRVDEATKSFRVKDLVTKLSQMVEQLSASSEIKDMIFLTQNLHTLGGFVMGNEPPLHAGPIKELLDELARRNHERVSRQGHFQPGQVVTTRVAFGRPRFRLERDLNNKQIRTTMQANGKDESIVMGYRDFFESVLQAAGEHLLC